jgi:hypothetical protein
MRVFLLNRKVYHKPTEQIIIAAEPLIIDAAEQSTEVAIPNDIKENYRPKGSTNESKCIMKYREQHAVHHAAVDAFKLNETSAKGNDFKERVTKGTYENNKRKRGEIEPNRQLN